MTAPSGKRQASITGLDLVVNLERGRVHYIERVSHLVDAVEADDLPPRYKRDAGTHEIVQRRRRRRRWCHRATARWHGPGHGEAMEQRKGLRVHLAGGWRRRPFLPLFADQGRQRAERGHHRALRQAV